MQAFTRGDEVRSSRLPNLCHEVNFGPYRLSEQGFTNIMEQLSPHGILSITQQPLTTKHMSDRAHAVGFFFATRTGVAVQHQLLHFQSWHVFIT